MPFDSLFFILIFLPLVLILYSITPRKYKGLLLIISSLFFYSYYDAASAARFLLYGIAVYFLSHLLQKFNCNRWVFVLSLALTSSYLIYYKYLDFLITNLVTLIPRFGFLLKYVPSQAQPLGISFFTFTSIAYLTDIYRNKGNRLSLMNFLNYLTFFPKVISGPIVRQTNFSFVGIQLSSFSQGLFRFVVGLSKKTILAYYLGVSVGQIWDQLVYGIDVPTAWIGAIAYSLQLYFDFSGYSDMAIGISGMLGYRLDKNFDFPYISTSIGEFWNRWHISLGKWFRYYIYYPLGGSKSGNPSLNLFFVFLLSGIWHGANWTFGVWGCWHGLLRVVEKTLSSSRLYRSTPAVIKWFFTMLAVVLGWVVFRSYDLSEARKYLGIMFGVDPSVGLPVTFAWKYFMNQRLIIICAISMVSATALGKVAFLNRIWDKRISNKWYVHLLNTAIMLLLFSVSIMMIVSSEQTPFIYFQF